MKFQLVTLFIVFIGLVSCKKSSSDPEPDLSSILTSHPWVHNGYTAIVDGQTYIGKNANSNYMGPDPSIIFTFKSDGTFLITEPNTSNSGKWTLSSTTLNMTNKDGAQYTFILSDASTTKLTMAYPEVLVSDQSNRMDFSLRYKTVEWP